MRDAPRRVEVTFSPPSFSHSLSLPFPLSRFLSPSLFFFFLFSFSLLALTNTYVRLFTVAALITILSEATWAILYRLGFVLGRVPAFSLFADYYLIFYDIPRRDFSPPSGPHKRMRECAYSREFLLLRSLRSIVIRALIGWA